jgi:hypothetical protein
MTSRPRTITDLSEPDPMSARFSPLGLLTNHAMTPDGSFAYLEGSIERARLHGRVPDALRRSFDRVRYLHLYGVFRYGFFTIADQIAWTIPEAALGVRFIEFYDGVIPFSRSDEHRTVLATTFRDVVTAVARRGQTPLKDGWRLDGHERWDEGRKFDASYRALMEWGRREGLLEPWLQHRWARAETGIRHAVLTRVHPPQYAIPDDWEGRTEEQRQDWWMTWRGRIWERDEIETLVELRNLTTHSGPEHMVTPVNSAHALVSSAEFVNALWPNVTAGAQAAE